MFKHAWLLIILTFVAMGCAPHAASLEDLKPGVGEADIIEKMGKPEKVRQVRFKGHERDYTVWEYKMVPDVPT